MKVSVWIFGLVFFLSLSCRKEENLPASPTLKLIQNDWTVISVRIFFPNGSNYKLLNDNQSFRNDNLQITKISGIASASYDTAQYKLLADDSTLLFYPIQNGIQSLIADTAFIGTINDNLFVYYFRENGFVNAIDSLQR